MAFFLAPPVLQPIIDDDLDVETAALIANLALDDLADHMSTRANSLPSNDEIAYVLQCERLDEWLSTVADAKDAKSIDSALVTDAAHLDPFITAEEAAVVDWIAAERLSLGEALPGPKNRHTRLEVPKFPKFIMDPELITVPEMPVDVTQSDQAGPDDAAHLNPFITAEKAVVENRIAAERLSRGEALPVPKSRQTRLEVPSFIMDPELITVPEMPLDVTQSDQARPDDTAHLNPFITAEEAAVENRIAAERLSRGEALPVPKSRQTRLEVPNFIMDPDLITVPEMDATSHSDQAGPDASNTSNVVMIDETEDNESTDGEQIESDSDDIYVPFFSIARFISIRAILWFLVFVAFFSFFSFLSF